MGLINNLPAPTPIPLPTAAQLQERLRTQVIHDARRLNAMLKHTLIENQRRFWAPDGEDGLTRQQRFDAFGTKARDLVAVALKTAELLVTADATFVPVSAPVAYTINADGTVTLAEE